MEGFFETNWVLMNDDKLVRGTRLRYKNSQWNTEMVIISPIRYSADPAIRPVDEWTPLFRLVFFSLS